MTDLSNDFSNGIAHTQEVADFTLESIFSARSNLIDGGFVPAIILVAQDKHKEFLSIEGLADFYDGPEDAVGGSFLGLHIYSGPVTDRILGGASLGVAALKKGY